MPKADPAREKTANYALGYSRARQNSDKRWANRLRQLIDALRIARRDLVVGIGRCKDCRHYVRGCDTCQWGYCEAVRLKALGSIGEWEVAQEIGWAHIDYRPMAASRPPPLALTVHQNFGCTNFQGRK